MISQTNFLFSQNGSTAYKRNQLFHVAYLTDKYTDEQLNSFINYALRYLSDLDLPIKRGTFIQFRTSMINICPLGRDASLKERIFFEEYDKIHHIREKMIEDLKAHFKELNFTYLIGGQTSLMLFQTVSIKHTVYNSFPNTMKSTSSETKSILEGTTTKSTTIPELLVITFMVLSTLDNSVKNCSFIQIDSTILPVVLSFLFS